MVVPSAPHPSPVTVACVERLDALEAHGAAWDALAASLPPCLPMLTHAWFATYVERTAIPDGAWLALLAHDGDDLVGVLAGVLRGAVLHVPCDYHTEDGDVVLAPGREVEVLDALLAGLARHRAGVHGVALGGVREDSPTNVALAGAPRGWRAFREPAVEGSSFPVRDDAEAWFQGLSKNLRGDLKRSANRIRKDGLGEPAFSFLVGDDARPELLDDLMRLEASGWKGESGNAIAHDAGTERKYRGLATRFAAHGMLEWHRLHLGDRLVAMHMAVRMGGKLMLLRQAFEDDLSRYGVGNLLLRRTVEREHERGPGGEVNLVTDYAWCRRWRMALTRYDRVRLVRRSPLAWLRLALPIHVRRMARRAPGARRAVRWVRSPAGAGGKPPPSR